MKIKKRDHNITMLYKDLLESEIGETPPSNKDTHIEGCFIGAPIESVRKREKSKEVIN